MFFYVGDLHFGHENIIRFDNRPFANAAEMDAALIRIWNERVSPTDTVYVIGDAFWKNEEGSIAIFEQLNGHKHLIKGNHDRVHGKLGRYWESVKDFDIIADEKRQVVLSHYPMPFYPGQHYCAVMLYAHVHKSKEWTLLEKWIREARDNGIPCRMINTGCMHEYMAYGPRTLDELLAANPVDVAMEE